LRVLLKDINYLYKTKGINYDINQFYYALLRLLTPFELLSHFQVADNSGLFADTNNYYYNNNQKNKKGSTMTEMDEYYEPRSSSDLKTAAPDYSAVKAEESRKSSIK
jgi:hypothetical protein